MKSSGGSSLKSEAGIPEETKINDFSHDERIRYGRAKWARLVKAHPGINKVYWKTRYRNNPEKYCAKAKKWRAVHPERARACVEAATEKRSEYYKAFAKRWRGENKEYLTEYHKERSKNPEVREKRRIRMRLWIKRRGQSDPAWRAVHNMRRILSKLIKTSRTHYSKSLGFSSAEIREHLERKFKPGMSWENYGSKWVADHVLPVASFDLTKPDQVKACFSLFNLQPLWKKENRDKWHKLPVQTELFP